MQRKKIENSPNLSSVLNAKYKYLETESNDYTALTHALEVEIRGYISKENRKMLHRIYKLSRTTKSFKEFQENTSRLAINASYCIYMYRNQTEWADLPLLKA